MKSRTQRGLTLLAGLVCSLTASVCAAENPTPPVKSVPYTVNKGDTLIGIARAAMTGYGDWKAIGALNHIARPRRLRPGLVLQLPYERLRFSPEVAHIIAFSGAVTVQSSAARQTVRLGAEVREGDELATGANAFLTVEMSDGSRMTLPSHSAVRLDFLRVIRVNNARDVVYSLSHGRAQSSVTHITRPENHFLVRTPVSISAVRGTELRVGFAPDQGAGVVEVLQGLVGVGAPAGDAQVAVAEGQGVITSAGGVSPPRPLLPRPVLVHPGRVQTERGLRFGVTPVEGARQYKVQIARDAGLTDIFDEAVSDAPEVSLPGPPDGDYFVRLTAVSAEGLEGLPKTYSFHRTLFTPEAPASAKVDGHRRFVLRWFGGGEGAVFRFQMARDAAFTDLVVDLPGLAAREATLVDLPKGAYWWRVVAQTTREQQTTFLAAPTQSFEVAAD